MDIDSSNSDIDKYIKHLHKIKRVTKIDGSSSSSSRRRNSRRNSRKRTMNNKTRKVLYKYARALKDKNLVCRKSISKMKKTQLIKFIKEYS